MVDASSGSPFRTLVRGRTTTLVVASAARSCGAVGSDRWTVGGDSVAGGVLGAASGVEGVAPGAADVAEVARGAAKGASGVATGATGVDRDAAGMAGSSSSAPGGPISASPAGGGSHGVSGEGAAGPAVGRDECGSGCAVGKGNDDDGAEAPGSAIDRCTGGFTSGWEVTSGWLVTGPGRTGGADIDESAGEGVDGRAGNGEDANGKDGEAEAIGPTVDRCTGDVTTSSSGPLAGAVVTTGSEVMAGVAIAGSAATTGSTGTTGSAVTASGRSTAPPAPSVSLTSRWIATGAGRTSGGGLTDPSEEKVEGCEDGEGSDGGREACSAVDRGAGDVTARWMAGCTGCVGMAAARDATEGPDVGDAAGWVIGAEGTFSGPSVGLGSSVWAADRCTDAASGWAVGGASSCATLTSGAAFSSDQVGAVAGSSIGPGGSGNDPAGAGGAL